MEVDEPVESVESVETPVALPVFTLEGNNRQDFPIELVDIWQVFFTVEIFGAIIKIKIPYSKIYLF